MINRRDWIQTSLLASATVLLPTLRFKPSQIEKELGDQVLRLHWNENPFGPPESVLEKVKAAAANCNLYWDVALENLANDLAAKQGLSKENYYITSGSTEILSLLGQQVGLMKGEILTPWPSFPTMMIFGERCGASVKKVSLNANDIDLGQIKDGISDKTKLIFICNPNNPTSTEVNNAELRAFIKGVPANIFVVIDEAYIEFSTLGEQGSVVKMIKDHPNLIVCRTFSKAYGCAGFRIGYAISQSENIKALAQQHPSFGMSPGLIPAIAAQAALKDDAFVKHTVNQTNIGKAKVYKAFDQWGVDYETSSTNFIYAKEDRFVPDFKAKLLDKNIKITKWGLMKDHVRISVGKPEWMQKFLENAEELLEK